MELDKFVRSPFFNQHKDVIALFEFLQKQSEQPVPDWTKFAAFEALFPGETYKDLRIRHVMSYLVKLMEQFFTYLEFQQDPVASQLALTRHYRNRSLPKEFKAALNKLDKLIDRSPRMDAESHYFEYQFHLERFEVLVDRTTPVQEIFQGLSDELDAYFIISKLKLAVIILNHRKMFKVKYELGLLEELVRYVEQSGLNRIPAVDIYYNCYQILTHDEPEGYFRKLVPAIGKYGGNFKHSETQGLYLFAINFCIKQINLGKEAYVREVFELYRQALESDYLIDEGILSPWTYKNISSAALKLEEYEWVDKFNYTYRKWLPADYQDSFYHFNNAKLYLATKEYSKVVKTLNRIDTKDVFTLLGARVMQVKAQYELGEFQLIEYLLDNFKQLLRRKEVLTYHKRNYSNFVKFTSRLIRLKPGDQKAQKKLETEILAAEILTEREWLLAKMK